MTDEASSNEWLKIPKTVEVLNSASNLGVEKEHTNDTSNTVLGLECFSWARVSDGLPTKQPVPDFLYRLTCMLLHGPNDIIEWQLGRIIIHNPMALESDLLKQYFRHSNFMSFKRQLNYFGFRKLSGSKEKFSPCVYINENVGPDVKKLLTIKRRYPTSSMKSQESIQKASSLHQDKKDVPPTKKTGMNEKWTFDKSDESSHRNNGLSEGTKDNPSIRRIRSAPVAHTDYANAQPTCAFAKGSLQGVLSCRDLSEKCTPFLSSDIKSNLSVSMSSSIDSSWLEYPGLAKNALCESSMEKVRLYQSRGKVYSQGGYIAKIMPNDAGETATCFLDSFADVDVDLATSASNRFAKVHVLPFRNTCTSSFSSLPDDLLTNFEAALRQSRADGAVEANVQVQSNYFNSCPEAHMELPLAQADKNFHTFPSDSEMMDFFHHSFDCSTDAVKMNRESSLEHLARIPSRSEISAADNSYTSMHSFSSASLHVFDDE